MFYTRSRETPLPYISPRETLTREILDKSEAVKESEQTTRKKRRWSETLEGYIKEAYPSCRLLLVGSSTTGFGIEGCDVDLTIIRPERTRSFGLDSGVSVLRSIQERLRARMYSISTELISTAVVPILKLKDRSNGLEGDVSVDVQNSIFNTYLQTCYGKMDPRVTPLVVTVKYWAKRSGITGARDHKLSGFAVVLLVIYFLQKGCSPPVLPSLQSIHPLHFNTTSYTANNTADKLVSGAIPSVVTSYRSENTDTLGQLLAKFFCYYSEFNWNQVLSVSRGGSKSVPGSKKWTRPCIRIEDPFDGTNVTRAVYKLEQFSAIKQAFKVAKSKMAVGSVRLGDIL